MPDRTGLPWHLLERWLMALVARQAGIFLFVVATGYLVEHFRYRGVALAFMAKSTAVVFLVAMALAGTDGRSVPFSAAADCLMGFTIWFVRRKAHG